MSRRLVDIQQPEKNFVRDVLVMTDVNVIIILYGDWNGKVIQITKTY